MNAGIANVMVEEIVSALGNSTAKKGSPPATPALRIPGDEVFIASQGGHPIVKQFLETLWFF